MSWLELAKPAAAEGPDRPVQSPRPIAANLRASLRRLSTDARAVAVSHQNFRAGLSTPAQQRARPVRVYITRTGGRESAALLGSLLSIQSVQRVKLCFWPLFSLHVELQVIDLV